MRRRGSSRLRLGPQSRASPCRPPRRPRPPQRRRPQASQSPPKNQNRRLRRARPRRRRHPRAEFSFFRRAVWRRDMCRSKRDVGLIEIGPAGDPDQRDRDGDSYKSGLSAQAVVDAMLGRYLYLLRLLTTIVPAGRHLPRIVSNPPTTSMLWVRSERPPARSRDRNQPNHQIDQHGCDENGADGRNNASN